MFDVLSLKTLATRSTAVNTKSRSGELLKKNLEMKFILRESFKKAPTE